MKAARLRWSGVPCLPVLRVACVHEAEASGTRLGSVPDVVEDRRAELLRLGHPTVPHVDSIGVSDRGSGNDLLSGSPRGVDFQLFGGASAILERLRALPDHAGPERVRSEFASAHPTDDTLANATVFPK